MNRSKDPNGSPSRLRRTSLRRLLAVLAVVLATAAATLLTAGPAIATVLSGSHMLVNRQSGWCLDVDGAKTGNGAEVRTWRCVNGPNQRWEPLASSGETQLRVAHTGKCLTVREKVEYWADLMQDVCEGRPEQRWIVGAGHDGWSTVRTPDGKWCLDKTWNNDATLWPCEEIPTWRQWNSLG